MIDQGNWQDGNARYLSLALVWLRLLLERQAQRVQAPETKTVSPSEPALPASKQGFLRRSSVEPVPRAPTALPAVAGSIIDEQIAEQASKMAEAESQMESPPALVVLCERLGLSPFEREVLLLCIAMELDTRIASLCARAQDNPGNPYPTFALAMALFDAPSWDVLSPERPIRHWRLIEINQPGAQPLTTSPLRADERIVHYIKGLDYLDDRLASFVAPLEVIAGQEELPASQEALIQQIKDYWLQALRQTVATTMLPVFQFVGPDVPSKQLVAGQVASEQGRPLHRLPIEMLPSQMTDVELLARLWQRESMLQPLAIYLDAQDFDGASPNEGQAPHLRRFLAHCNHPLFLLGVREVWPHLGRANLVVDISKPTPAEQQVAWKRALGDADTESSMLLASHFNLNLPTIQRMANAALDPSISDEQSAQGRLWTACLLNVRPRLDTLAQRLDPKVNWDDLVLPPEEMDMLHQLADQMGQRSKVYEEWGFASKMNRGLGINALFAGESGTGKTMAAEVIANSLRLNLYRIDLSAVVSKYIGETEKNLRRLFDAAEDGGTILFFDEADALFGKRSEVKDSHDRYANIEINYLLQRMEAYRGIAILATNMKSALDAAFIRRLRFIVNFPFPGSAERKLIWQKTFPADTPREELNYERLARFDLTGGSIHTIVLNAAFRAAQESKPVSMQLVLSAVRAEHRKMDRQINEAEFRWHPVAAAQGARG
ncbi:MAG: ATP-binding protein [Ktedonobacteraceae bacterium]